MPTLSTDKINPYTVGLVTSTTITPELPEECFCTCGNVLVTDEELENGLCDECADAPLDLIDVQTTLPGNCNATGPASCSACRLFASTDARRAKNFTESDRR